MEKKTIKSRLLLTPELSKLEIESINENLKQLISCIDRELCSLPEGILYIRYRNSIPNYSKRINGHTYGITKKPDIIYKLARRRFLLLQSSIIRQLLDLNWTRSTLDTFNKKCVQVEELLAKYEAAGLDINLIVMTPNQQIWNSNRHSQSQYRREDLIFPTRGRVYMRSKSEQAIGNLFEKLHIPYRYETRLRISNIDYHPDFIIMLPDDRLVILEHVGRMDLTDYNKRLIARLQTYNSVNLFLGREVFLSFEHDTRDEDLLIRVILQLLTSRPTENRFLVYAARNAGCNIDLT